MRNLVFIMALYAKLRTGNHDFAQLLWRCSGAAIRSTSFRRSGEQRGLALKRFSASGAVGLCCNHGGDGVPVHAKGRCGAARARIGARAPLPGLPQIHIRGAALRRVQAGVLLQPRVPAQGLAERGAPAVVRSAFGSSDRTISLLRIMVEANFSEGAPLVGGAVWTLLRCACVGRDMLLLHHR